MLPTPATAPSIFCMIWVSTSWGEAPGCATCTSNTGKATSGLSVTGTRRNDTVPMKSSTTNSTIGVTGWRIAHAEMFFMTALSGRGRFRRAGDTPGSDVDRLAIAQEATGGRHHTLRAGEPLGDDDAAVGGARDAHGVPLDLACRIHHQHVTAVRVGHDGG